FGSALLVLALVVQQVFLRSAAADPELRDYWSGAFLALDRRFPPGGGKGVVSPLPAGRAGGLRRLGAPPVPPGVLPPRTAWAGAQPVAAPSVGATLLITLLASAVGVWPLGARLNLALIVVMELCLAAGAVVAIGWAVRRMARGGSDAGLPLRATRAAVAL